MSFYAFSAVNSPFFPVSIRAQQKDDMDVIRSEIRLEIHRTEKLMRGRKKRKKKKKRREWKKKRRGNTELLILCTGHQTNGW